jgi:hypothetical protein
MRRTLGAYLGPVVTGRHPHCRLDTSLGDEVVSVVHGLESTPVAERMKLLAEAKRPNG